MQDLDRDKHVSVHAESLKALVRFAETREDYVLAAKAEEVLAWLIGDVPKM